GILKEAEERAAALYHSLETHYLINGSTTGILSAVMGCTAKGDRILMARNCHKSVYHAVLMHELRPVYIYPEFYADVELNGPVKPKDIENALDKYEDIKAVVITSPTYDGVISDIKSIAAVVHRKGIPLIVDEAHGAHLGFHPYFAKNSVSLGADVVIHSLHKTLPALTQTA
ncbi:aminotransferase class I/II-fold pyridoxal phosphate-dependent enzyme, partial [Romboutsia ilealis]|nr:aminotransferase class I/II-fold pyridoxal phosphate-dependent enzyme [Romboutsia ilealis]